MNGDLHELKKPNNKQIFVEIIRGHQVHNKRVFIIMIFIAINMLSDLFFMKTSISM